jgi:hypothetical protein
MRNNPKKEKKTTSKTKYVLIDADGNVVDIYDTLDGAKVDSYDECTIWEVTKQWNVSYKTVVTQAKISHDNC